MPGFVPLSRSLVIVFVSLSYSSRIRIVFARDRMRYVGRPPGTQSQHLVSPLLVGCCRGPRAKARPDPRPGPNDTNVTNASESESRLVSVTLSSYSRRDCLRSGMMRSYPLAVVLAREGTRS